MRDTTYSVLQLLRRYESRNITFMAPDGSWPIVWARARGNHVWDLEGKRYLDLTAAFGVAATGHANPRVVRAGQRQMETLLHAMGDVHPHALKAQLARELSRLTFERWASAGSKASSKGTHGKTIFCNSGFEAVEAALKTAFLATRKRMIVAFRGGYHGLGYGALNATARDHFRSPFVEQLGGFGEFLDFPHDEERVSRVERSLRQVCNRGDVGAVLVEPVQTRGGINVAPPGFLPMLRRVCDEQRALLILDEIYTGFGRTGRWFACEHWKVTPDLTCVGKALTGGFPLSACIGRAEIMDRAWPTSEGEAIHTSTFLGHPVGCAMALAQIAEIGRGELVERSAVLGRRLLSQLQELSPPHGITLNARGLGLLVGLEARLEGGKPATDRVLGWIKAMLGLGYSLLPEGEASNVLAFTPPLTIAKRNLDRAVIVLKTLFKLS